MCGLFCCHAPSRRLKESVDLRFCFCWAAGRASLPLPCRCRSFRCVFVCAWSGLSRLSICFESSRLVVRTSVWLVPCWALDFVFFLCAEVIFYVVCCVLDTCPHFLPSCLRPICSLALSGLLLVVVCRAIASSATPIAPKPVSTCFGCRRKEPCRIDSTMVAAVILALVFPGLMHAYAVGLAPGSLSAVTPGGPNGPGCMPVPVSGCKR